MPSIFASRFVPSVASVTTMVLPVDLTLFLVAVASTLAISAIVAALKASVAELNVVTFALIEFSAVSALDVSASILVSSLATSPTVAALNEAVVALKSLTFELVLSILPSSLATSLTVAALNDTVAALKVSTIPLIDCSANVALPISLLSSLFKLLENSMRLVSTCLIASSVV